MALISAAVALNVVPDIDSPDPSVISSKSPLVPERRPTSTDGAEAATKFEKGKRLLTPFDKLT
jgi:hypothetical protein